MISATQLYDYVQCPHRVFMDAFGDPADKDQTSPFVELLWEQGLTHETAIAANLNITANMKLVVASGPGFTCCGRPAGPPVPGCAACLLCANKSISRISAFTGSNTSVAGACPSGGTNGLGATATSGGGSAASIDFPNSDNAVTTSRSCRVSIGAFRPSHSSSAVAGTNIGSVLKNTVVLSETERIPPWTVIST